jgi:hypothetical protein
MPFRDIHCAVLASIIAAAISLGPALDAGQMLTRYHDEFLRLAPPGLPAAAMPYLTSPILLAQSRPELAAIFMKTPAGLAMVQPVVDSVRTALLHGLQQVFFFGAVQMAAAVLPHLFLKREPLRSRTAPADASAAAPIH